MGQPKRASTTIEISQSDTANFRIKQLIKAAGGDTLHLAIAMLEDEALDSYPHLPEYPFGDKYPSGEIKTGDAACFGIYKMNWYMIRQVLSYMGMMECNPIADAWIHWGRRINSEATLATQILLRAMTMWSAAQPTPTNTQTNFWAGHRGGSTGFEGKAPKDWRILGYYLAVQAIKDSCDADPTVWETSVRYGADIPPI